MNYDDRIKVNYLFNQLIKLVKTIRYKRELN